MSAFGDSDYEVADPAPAIVSAPVADRVGGSARSAPAASTGTKLTRDTLDQAIATPITFGTVDSSRVQRSPHSGVTPTLVGTVDSSRVQRSPHSGVTPSLVGTVDSSRIQRSPHGGVTPSLVGTVDSSRVQRELDDGAAPGLSALPPSLTAASFKSRSSVRAAKRGSELQQIDKWLAEAEGATTQDERDYALDQACEACEVWVNKHRDDDGGGSRSVKARRPYILQLLSQLTIIPRQSRPAAPIAPDRDKPAEDDNGEQRLALIGGVLDAVADSSGITGDYGDINLGTTSADKFDPSEHGSMSQGGGGSINNQFADMAEGANAITGIIGIARGFHAIDEAEDGWETAEAVGDTLASTGKMIHGAYKVTKGIAIQSGGDKTTYTQVGDIGAAYADGLGTVAGFISWVKSIRDARKKSKEQGGLTNSEKAETGAEIASSSLSVLQGGTKTALDITKAVTQVGATEAIVALSTVAAALGLVVGTIETARGGMQMYRGWSAKKTIASTRAAQEKFLNDFHTSLAGSMEETYRQVAGAEIDVFEFSDLIDKWEELETVYAEMETVVRESEGAFEALRKLQNRQMEQGAVKMAQGVTAIVSGALLLSGVGAPIAIGVAAIAGIIALSYAGVGLARNSAASTMIELARRLDDDGVPKAKPDEEPSYRLMTRRVEDAYYKNLRSVLENKTPFGFTESEFRTIEQFVWDDKKDRLSSDDRNICDDWQEFDKLTRAEQKASWIQVGHGDASKKEKPKNWTKLSRAARPSAHKSSQAMEANKLEVAEALWKLGSGSFNGASFVSAPVTPQGNVDDVGDRDLVAEMRSVTVTGLLDAADITESRWKAWWDDSSDDADNVDTSKMIKHIVDHLR